MTLNLIIGCSICTIFFVVILRFTLKRRVNAQAWKLQKNKTFIDRWLLFGVYREVPTLFFFAHLLLTLAILLNLGLGILARIIVHWKLYNFICTSSVAVLMISVILIEPARHFQCR